MNFIKKIVLNHSMYTESIIIKVNERKCKGET